MSSGVNYPTNSDDIINVIIHEIVKKSRGIAKSKLLSSRIPPPGQSDRGFEEEIKAEVDTDITEVLAAFIIRAAIVDPSNEFDVEKEFSRQDVEKLIEICVNFIVQDDSPRLETLRMQLAFDTTLPIQGDHLRKFKANKASHLAPLLRDILECQSKKLTSVEELYRKVVTYVIIKSELGDPLDINVVKEATAALESTFPNSEVNVFISLPRKDKESQLIGLTQLVTGIRLFNKELGKGGESIPNIPLFCSDELNWVTSELKSQTERANDCISLYTAAILWFQKQDEDENAQIKSTGFENELFRLKEALIFWYQFASYLKVCEENRANSEKTLSSNNSRFNECLRELKNTCKAKTAVPVDHVYPQFMLLSTCWNILKDELFFLEFRRNILKRMTKYSRNFTVEVPSVAMEAIKTTYKKSLEKPKLSDLEIISKSADLMSTVGLYTKKIEVLHPGNSSMYDKLKAEYSGFCPFTLVSSDCLLLPGDLNLGLLRYKDKLFSFSSFDAAIEFSKDTESVIQKVIDKACVCPQLVHLLFLHKYFPTFAALENVRSFAKQKLLGKVTVTYDAVSQTDTHIVDTLIDKSYEWNEWELRRKAIMLVNLRHKITHSTQTNKSHFRREMETQHYEPKGQATQTVRDSSTSVPKKVNFLQGLRHPAGKPSKLNVVDLTLQFP